MNALSLYELIAPTKWAEPPKVFSFSSLKTILECPRRWQLLHSEWGEHSRFPVRMHPAALEGQIVHAALDLLSRSLGRCGRPPIGSPSFQKALQACDFWVFFARKIKTWNHRLAEHPKAGPYFLLRVHPRELANRTIRLFRERYCAGITTSNIPAPAMQSVDVLSPASAVPPTRSTAPTTTKTATLMLGTLLQGVHGAQCGRPTSALTSSIADCAPVTATSGRACQDAHRTRSAEERCEVTNVDE